MQILANLGAESEALLTTGQPDGLMDAVAICAKFVDKLSIPSPVLLVLVVPPVMLCLNQ